MSRFALACVLALLAMVAFSARAQSCSVTLGDMQFSPTDTTSPSPNDLNGSMTVNCTGYATPYVRACLNLGTPDGAWDVRTMGGPTATRLKYEIYSDAARTKTWYAINDPQQRVVYTDITLSGGAGSAVVPYYARVFGGQTTVPPGSYQAYYGTGDENVKGIAYSGTPPVCSAAGNFANFPFYVKTTVVSNCSLSATNIDFGSIGFLTSPVNVTGIISTTCSTGTSYAIALNAGMGSGATVANRSMTLSGGGSSLAYGLYKDAGRTQAWGDGSSGTTTSTGTGNGSAQTATVYATMPVQPRGDLGSYVDTITVTVTY